MTVIQENVSHRERSDPSSKPAVKPPTAFDPYTCSGYPGLMTPPLPSPSPHSHTQHNQSHTPPREFDNLQERRLPPISELLKLVPSPAMRLPTPPRLSNIFPTYKLPTPTSTPQPSLARLSSPQSFHRPSWSDLSQSQYQPSRPIHQMEPRCPSPPTNHRTHPPPRTTGRPQKMRRMNTLYTQEQEYCIRYFAVDLGYSWKGVLENYTQWFPAVDRTVSALTCEYYRTNKQIPVLEDGLLVFTAPREADEKLSKTKYKGMHFVCKEQKCRSAKIHSLLSIFPEEYEDLANRWIRPEHRGKGREAARRRRGQRERYLRKPY